MTNRPTPTPRRGRGKLVLWDGQTGTVEDFHNKIKEVVKPKPKEKSDGADS